MHTRFEWRDWRIYVLIILIFITSFMVTSFHHVEYHVKLVNLCNNTQLRALYYPVAMVPSLKLNFLTNETETIHPFWPLYTKWGKYVQSFTVVVFPIIAVGILNYSLIAALQRPEDHRERSLVAASERPSGKNSVSRKESDKIRFSDLGTIQRQERRVTITVLAIVTCFTLTHAPTLIPFVWESIDDSATRYPIFINMVSIINNVLVIGKVMNFVLFCSVSSHFRKRMMALLFRRKPKKYSSGSTSLQSRHKHSVQLSTYRSRPRLQKFSTTSTQLDY
ncbi:hypothetical protein L596_005359 [Steinernema carpocapsae]|nr:hypothetical protein L596_005359 [Steinernema carpocapsae]